MKLSIRQALVAALLVLAFAVVATNLLLIYGTRTQTENLRTVYDDRIVPMEQLKTVSDAYSAALIDNVVRAEAGMVSPVVAAKDIRAAMANADKRWAEYEATFLVPEEKKLVDKVNDMRSTAQVVVLAALDALDNKDNEKLRNIHKTSLYAKTDPLIAVLGDLIKLQIKTTKEIYQDSRSDGSTLLAFALFFMAFGVVAIGFAFWVVVHRTTRPLSDMTQAMQRLAGNDLSTSIPCVGRQDEIGAMAEAMAIFKGNALERQRLEAEQKKQAEERERRARQIETLTELFEHAAQSVTGEVARSATEMQHSADGLTHIARQTREQATVAAAATEQASSNIQTVAASAEELTASIHEISGNVQRANEIATVAAHKAGQADHAVGELSNKANAIGDVVRLITQIANQTNLLALNATIEAARAGEAGRGFAVVAVEVKNLAAQTAKATEDISSQINAMQGATQDTVDVIRDIVQAISAITESSTTIAAAIEEQSAATAEIGRNVNQASDGTREIANTINGVQQIAHRTQDAADHVLGAAGSLANQSQRLAGHVQEFLAGVRAA